MTIEDVAPCGCRRSMPDKTRLHSCPAHEGKPWPLGPDGKPLPDAPTPTTEGHPVRVMLPDVGVVPAIAGPRERVMLITSNADFARAFRARMRAPITR